MDSQTTKNDATPTPPGRPNAPGVAPAEPLAGDLEVRVLRALRRIMQAIDIHSRKLASAYHITGPQLVALLAIAEAGHITPSRIAEQIHLSSSTVVGILDRLEGKGLVVRQRSQSDRRNVYVSVTERGADVARTAPSPLQDTLSQALATLPHLEQAAIALSLERVVGLIDAEHIDAAPLLETGSLKPSVDE